MLASSTKREKKNIEERKKMNIIMYTRSASYIISIFFIAQHARIPFCLTSIIHPNDPRVYVYIYIGNRMKKEKNLTLFSSFKTMLNHRKTTKANLIFIIILFFINFFSFTAAYTHTKRFFCFVFVVPKLFSS
jgi:hypothetical protein